MFLHIRVTLFQSIHNYAGSTSEGSSFTYYHEATEQKWWSSVVGLGK